MPPHGGGQEMTPDGPLPGDDRCVSCINFSQPQDAWAGKCKRNGVENCFDTYAEDKCEHHDLDPVWAEWKSRVHGVIVRQANGRAGYENHEEKAR